MKKLFKYLFVPVMAAGLVSCGFLDENMNTKYSDQNIFGSENALETYIAGCYAAFESSGFKGGEMCEWFAPASGLVHWGLGSSTTLSDGQKRWIDCLSFNQYSRNPANINVYKNLYTAIYKCNKIIDALKSSPVDENYKNQIEAEARFLRAQSYFHLVRRWGNIPIHVEPATTIAQTSGTREPFWKVYDIILKDLEFTETYGRSYDEQVRISGLAGSRICKNAGTAAKSLVYLTIGTLLAHSDTDDNFWTCSNEEVFNAFAGIGIPDAKTAFNNALEAAKAVMPETNPESPYRLATNYRQLFSWTNQEDWELRERIFVAPSTTEAGGSNLAIWSLPASYMGCTGSGSLFCRFVPSRFVFQKWCETYGGVKGTGKAADIFIGCGDPRLDATMIYYSYPDKDMQTKYNYPYPEQVKSTARPTCFPIFKKYFDPKFNASAGYADLYLMRLAEVYLIAAEACANLCNNPGETLAEEAMGYVNILLARARRSTADGSISAQPADWEPTDFASKDDLINRIFWERAFEMLGEEHEVYDTHRMGAKWLAENISVPENEFLYRPEQEDYDGKTGFRGTYYGNPRFGAKQIFPEDPVIVRKGLLTAFPYDELVYNPALTMADQNPSEIFTE